MRHASKITIPMFATGALLLFVGLTGACGKAKDDFDSRVVCHKYCDKDFQCKATDPTSEQSDACVSDCRNSIENNCGNDHQAAANDKIGECVDMACIEFRACMVFDAAPACFGFVN